MKKWLQKGLMITVAMITLGSITPTHEIWDAFDHKTKTVAAAAPTYTEQTEHYEHRPIEPVLISKEQLKQQLVEAAREQAYVKFGTRIAPKIEREFEQVVFPKIEEAISATVERMSDTDLSQLAITETPSGAYAEKIFHIYNEQTGEDVIRFHVRTDKRALDGYYYNFHYHTVEDDFMTHYTLADIFWAKDTPPKWMS
ncbi:YpjP family protein [Caryophanon latum]|uniref:Cell division protein FtsK n=1 Tax=Caryophanon latum TaxID=33977 RepID=A0A1C0YUN5_9BACL|nr:YpjP family protein [Caryophanon latum]OCS90869.1 hypothetical protein A6K76_02115 [Caryophanon latum]